MPITKPVKNRIATLIVAASNASGLIHGDYQCDGVNDEVEIQAAINALPANGDRKIVLMGDFTHGGSVINLPSNITIELNGSISFKNSVADGTYMFQNKDSSNTNIVFKEGILKGNSANQSAGTRGFFNFVKVSSSVVDCYMQDLALTTGASPYYGDSVLNIQFGYYVNQDPNCSGNKIINRNYPNIVIPESGMVCADIQDHNSLFISDCNSNWTLTQNSSFDTAHFVTGTQSLKLVSGGQTTLLNAQAQFYPVTPLDLSKGHLHFLVYLDGTPQTNFNSFQITLVTSSGNTALCQTSSLIHLDGNWFVLDVILNPAEASWTIQGNYDPSSITRIILWMYSNTGTTQNAWIGRVWVTYPNTGGLVTFTLDDGLSRQKDYIIPILESAGFPAVTGIVTSLVGQTNYLTLADLQALQTKGWDIVSHTHTHKPLSYNGASVVEDEICKAKEYLIQNGFKKGSRFIIMPKTGEITSLGYDILKKHHVMARAIRGGALNTFPHFEQMAIKAIYLDSSWSLARAEAAVDAAIAQGGWVNFFVHTLNTTPWNTTEMSNANFQSLVNYVKASGVRVVTYSEVYDKYKNIPVIFGSYTDTFISCLGTSTTAIHTPLQNWSSAVTTGFTQPDVPRCISVTQAGTGTPLAGSMIINGIDALGRNRSETIAIPASNATTNGNIPWLQINSITGFNAGTNQTLAIGVCDKLGLSKPILKKVDVIGIKKNGSVIAVPTINAQYGTVDCSTITLNDTFVVNYRGNNNTIL